MPGYTQYQASVLLPRRRFEGRQRLLWRLCCAGILSIALLVPATLPAGQEPAVRFLSPESAATVHPGQFLTVRWTPLPPGTREFELLLLLDDSTGATVRLTTELDPARHSYRWRIPNLPSSSARLQIRLSRGAGEEPGATSAPFTISSNCSTSLAGLTFHGGEWWLAQTWGSSFAPIVPRRTRLAGIIDSATPLEPLESRGERDHVLGNHMEMTTGRTLKSGPQSRPRSRPSPPRRPASVPQRE